MFSLSNSQKSDLESKSPENFSQLDLDADISSSSSTKKKGEWLDPYHYRNKTIKLLGGDAFLSKNSFDLPVNYSSSQTFWIKIFHTTRISYRMTSRSERKKDGTFPLLLIQSINHCIERRRSTAPKFYARVTANDFHAAAEMMQSQAIIQAGEFALESLASSSLKISSRPSFSSLSLSLLCRTASEDFIPSSDESEQELSSDIAPKTESQRRSLIDRISLRWNSNAWMRERLRSDLAPISISYLDVLAPLADKAALTRSEEPTGFPPLVRKALNEALSNDEAMSKEGKVGKITSPSGWAQNRVVKSALQILKGYLQSEAASSSLQLQASSDAKDSKKQVLLEAKATLKRKLDSTISEEEKRKAQKGYKKLKKSIKRGIKREEDS